MEENKQENTTGWRENISEPKETLKIKPEESVTFVFEDEGRTKPSTDFGTSIVFSAKLLDGDSKLWYVSANNYDLLGQIKALGDVTGKKVIVSRKGSKRSDTRYSIKLA